MIYFTSDQHFTHTNIIRYCNRPFGDIKEMDRVLVANWNGVVSKSDLTFVLGDFAYRNRYGYSFLLNGDKVFILGNHDGKNSCLPDLLCIIGGIKFYMRHKPLYEGEVNRMAIMADVILCGHVHQNWKVSKWQKRPMINVGVDVWDYKPVSLGQVKQNVTMV